ncbi:hypothetical protein [Spirosoma rhododendri]|uniref:Uncharacterized protein n=1 Tax=Spirosoma rhododendri TaxID=2728024 RepID=A0A7L5DS38_9BACT|nr:hypothetical protein [Spirosoma rhododendri]QJD80251.1 hypothetical protein HH216_18875 [Spirosoma rhododendri]
MALDQHAENLVSLTKKAFGGDANSVSMTDGLSLIESWTSFLKTDPSTGTDILGGLDELKTQFVGGQPNATQVQQTLQKLAKQTEKLAGTVDAEDKSTLTSLAESLHNMSQQIGGTGHPAPTGGEAPMTSTVGGESTRSGAGISALADDGDDLADRQGGTRDDADESDDVDYMDDTTGSDGGIRAGEAEGDSAYSPQTGNSSANSSRSNASRVSGMGVSGGTADSESSQSEGRSQY